MRSLWSNLPQRLGSYYLCFMGGETEGQEGKKHAIGHSLAERQCEPKLLALVAQELHYLVKELSPHLVK